MLTKIDEDNYKRFGNNDYRNKKEYNEGIDEDWNLPALMREPWTQPIT